MVGFLDSNYQREAWNRFLEYHPELRGEFEDFDDEQPSYEDVISGEAKSPPALRGLGEFTFGVYQLIGHGKQTSERCGTFRKVFGCSRVELHNKVIFDKKGRLIDCRGKGYFKPVFNSCNKPSCPVCYERGWAVRAAKNGEFILKEASKHYGKPEHIIVGVPSKYWGLSEKAIRKIVRKALRVRGVIGGGLIFHGFRYNNPEEARAKGQPQGWYWSPHYHVVGFILGGYGKCRHCPYAKCKKGCGGFVDRNYRQNEIDGIYLKVKGKRKSLFGTLWYQLHHATIRTDRKRANVMTWFGICSYRKLKIDKELRKEWNREHGAKCPICGSDLVQHEYLGHDAQIISWFRKRRGARESVKGVLDNVSDWLERGSGSYG